MWNRSDGNRPAYIRDPTGRRADAKLAARWAAWLFLTGLLWGVVLPRMVNSRYTWLCLGGIFLALADVLFMGLQSFHMYRALRLRRGYDDYPKLTNRRF